MARVMEILRRDPRAWREDYNWALDLVPTEKSLSGTLRRTYGLVNNQVRDLKTALDGRVARAEGRFKSPLRVSQKGGGGVGAVCLLAFLGRGWFLIGEVKSTHRRLEMPT